MNATFCAVLFPKMCSHVRSLGEWDQKPNKSVILKRELSGSIRHMVHGRQSVTAGNPLPRCPPPWTHRPGLTATTILGRPRLITYGEFHEKVCCTVCLHICIDFVRVNCFFVECAILYILFIVGVKPPPLVTPPPFTATSSLG